jgi:hypothetical protein
MSPAIIILIVIAFGAPFLASAVNCAPEWYRERVSPTRLGSILTYDLNDIAYIHPAGSVLSAIVKSLLHFGFYLILLICYIPALVIFLIVGYFAAWFTLVENKCPYSVHSTDHTGNAAYFFAVWQKGFKSLLTFKFLKD